MANRRQGMRILRRAAMCLVLGAVITVIVAWVVAVTIAPATGPMSRPSGIGEGWSYWVGRRFGTVNVVATRAWFGFQEQLREEHLAARRREVPAWSVVHGPPGNDQQMHVEEGRGWPALALRCELILPRSTGDDSPGSLRWGGRVRDGDRAGDRTRPGGVTLPLRPIWSGFIADTLLFAVIASALRYGPGALRRASRRRRGRCERCGYDLRASTDAAKCPECGATMGNPTG